MQFSKAFQGLTLATLASSAAAAFDADSNQNVAVYWGQASAGSQEALSYYCDSDDVDIILLSFMTSFPGTNDVPTLNFASACSDQFDNGLLKCDTIGTDIKTCQSKGKKVLLSLGGESGSYGFSSDSEAEDFASTLWNLFGEGESDTRPFGDAVVDGFDFDIENNKPTGYAALAKKLRTIFESGSKDYYLSAAPQCVYPDASVGDLMENADLDFAFIQFYNNYCSVDKQFNWDTWTDYAANTSPNKNIKLYLGLPGSSSAAGSGYVDLSTIESTLSTIGSDSNFGGVMLWDASQGFTNKVDGDTFVAGVKNALESLSGSSSSTTAASSSTTAASPTSTSTSSTSQAAQVETSSTESSSVPISSAPTSTTPASSEVEPTSTTPASSEVEPTSTAAGSSEVEPTSTAAGSSEVEPTSTAPASPEVELTSTAPASSETEPTSSTLSYPEVTSNTFSALPSSFTSILTSTPNVSQTTLSNEITDSATATSSAPSGGSSATSVPDDCSSLSGLSKAQCWNKSYKAGQFNGETTQCTHGASACSANGEYAVCNWGEWVTFQCAAGTTCYAYSQNNEVFTGCNYQNQESQFVKRHAHHDH